MGTRGTERESLGTLTAGRGSLGVRGVVAPGLLPLLRVPPLGGLTAPEPAGATGATADRFAPPEPIGATGAAGVPMVPGRVAGALGVRGVATPELLTLGLTVL